MRDPGDALSKGTVVRGRIDGMSNLPLLGLEPTDLTLNLSFCCSSNCQVYLSFLRRCCFLEGSRSSKRIKGRRDEGR